MIRNHFDRVRVTTDCSGPSRTKQHFKDECDVNNIMARYVKSGLFTHVSRYQGRYVDFPDGLDFHEAQNMVAAANQMFATIPAEIRKRFGNDAGAFLSFAQNPENHDEMVTLGLAKSGPVIGGADAVPPVPPVPVPQPAPAPRTPPMVTEGGS